MSEEAVRAAEAPEQPAESPVNPDEVSYQAVEKEGSILDRLLGLGRQRLLGLLGILARLDGRTHRVPLGAITRANLEVEF